MAWAIEFERAAAKELAKLDKASAVRIARFLSERVARSDDPRAIGRPLKGSALGEFWRYQVGEHRVICRMEDARITVLVVRIGDRRDVYR